MSDYIYLDYAASTPIDNDVLVTLQNSLSKDYANPSNGDSKESNRILDKIEQAKNNILQKLQLHSHDLIFTSGATESLNTILKGIYTHPDNNKTRIITSHTEHSAVYEVCKELESYGAEIYYLKNDSLGNIDLKELEEATNENTLAIALMAVNNETGIIHPMEAISKIARQNNVYYICDTTQAIGKIPFDINLLDAAIVSAHKIYGPKGIGALLFNKEMKFSPMIHGGGHQDHRRAGTLFSPLIFSFEKVIEKRVDFLEQDLQKVKEFQDYFENEIKKMTSIVVIGEEGHRSPYISNIIFKDVDIQELKLKLKDHIAFSSGSACKDKLVQASRIIRSLNLDPNISGKTIRFSYGHNTTQEELDQALNHIKEAINNLK